LIHEDNTCRDPLNRAPMMKQFFRKFRPFFGKSQLARAALPFGKPRHFTHERLEPRLMMTINPTGAEFVVNDPLPGFQNIDENASSVAVSEAAGTLAAYAGVGAGKREGIFLRSFDQTGIEQGAAERVSSTVRGARSAASVAANDAGNRVVVWQGRGLGDKYGIFMQVFNTSGVAIGGEQLVNETVGGKQRDPSVAMAANGSFVVTWSGPSGSDATGVYARRFNADGSAASNEELVNTTTPNDQIESAVAVNNGGDYVITWSSRDQDTDDWGVFGQRFSAGGARQGVEFAVNTTTASSQRESSVALQDDGTFMVVWSSFGQDADSWAVIGRRFDSAGVGGSEFVVNTTTPGHQRHAQVAGASDRYLVTWQSGVANGSGWEVMAQQFDAVGTPVGVEQTVNSSLVGTNSGQQEHPAVALNASGKGAIVWSGKGATDRQGVFGRSFQDDNPVETNLAPDLAATTSSDLIAVPGIIFSFPVTAIDPNAGDTLSYQLDPTNSPAGATIVRTDNNNAVISWTPTDADQNMVVNFRVLVTDNGQPPLADVEDFQVTVTDGSIAVDLNGADESGIDTSATFFVSGGPVSVVDDDLLVVGAADGMITRATAQLNIIRNGGQEFLAVDADVLAETGINSLFIPNSRTLLLTGTASQADYQRLLRTLTYENTSPDARLSREVRVLVDDGTEMSEIATVDLTIGTADLVGFAQALAADPNVRLLGAAWSEASTMQRELFEDGGQFLPFTDVTNANRALNQTATDNGITDATIPVWLFSNGTRLEGIQSLEALAEAAGITIPVSDNPFIAPIANDTLLIGSPLHVSLDGYDPNGGPLTYSVTTDRPNEVTAEILENRTGNTNRSALINVAGYGDMVFELFEDRAARATNQFIDLVESDFYSGIIFHRVINGFVIQAGLRTSTETPDSSLDDFDDQFDVDLQHNRAGLLSYAKSNEDTNGSQYFVTEGATRNLDFHHSIFGVLVEGESNREAISNVAVNGEVPRFDVVTENAEIFNDTENAVLFLKANAGATGNVTVTVTATDQQGNTFDREFTMTLQEDTVNGRPFFNNEDLVAPASVTRGTTAQIQLAAAAIDVENDTIFYGAETPAENAVPYTFTVDQSGVVNITLTDPNATGTLQINVMAAASTGDFALNPGDGSLARSRRDGRVDLQLITIQVT